MAPVHLLPAAVALIVAALLFPTRLHAKQPTYEHGHLACRDPATGYGSDQIEDRKFVVLSSKGNGIGNYLVFFPSVYYFAALTGRDILLLDGTLLAEMCSLLHCGFPLYSDVQASFPGVLGNITHALLTQRKGNTTLPLYRRLRPHDFTRHLRNESLVLDRVVYAEGYSWLTGWQRKHEYAEHCVQQLTGCIPGDVSCEDRHALQQLVRGPFRGDLDGLLPSFHGAPENLKRAILSLPHAMAPRLDIAVHLRCQFRHFEGLVGPQDSQRWPQHQKEIQDFLQSDDFNAGEQLFKEIARRLTEEVQAIVARRRAHRQQQRRRWRRLRLDIAAENATAAVAEAQSEHERFAGDARSDRVYVYLASDNDQVKEAFAAYLVNHANLTVMRVRTGQHISHAKDLGWLRSESAGVFTLVADWYALSLANLVVAWRRDSYLPSTYAQSARMFSGNSLLFNQRQRARHQAGADADSLFLRRAPDDGDDADPREAPAHHPRFGGRGVLLFSRDPRNPPGHALQWRNF